MEQLPGVKVNTGNAGEISTRVALGIGGPGVGVGVGVGVGGGVGLGVGTGGVGGIGAGLGTGDGAVMIAVFELSMKYFLQSTRSKVAQSAIAKRKLRIFSPHHTKRTGF